MNSHSFFSFSKTLYSTQTSSMVAEIRGVAGFFSVTGRGILLFCGIFSKSCAATQPFVIAAILAERGDAELPSDWIGSNFQIEVISMDGAVVKKGARGFSTLNVEDLSPAIYLIRISGEKGVMTSSFMKD